MADRGETEHIHKILDYDGRIAQQTRDVQCCIAIDPVVRRIAAVSLDGLGEVFARHMEAFGIIRQFAVFAELALFEQLQKAFHEDGGRRGDGLVAIERGMEIKEVNNHPLHGIQQHVAVEEVRAHTGAFFNIQHRPMKSRRLLVFQRHNGILEQQHAASHSIVAHRRCKFDELGLDKDIEYLEILRPAHQLALFALAQDKTVVFAQAIPPPDEFHFRFSAQAQRVRQLPLHLPLLRGGKSMTNDDVFAWFILFI